MITRIQLDNFKCFESQPLNIGKLTLLAGLNGMGKSSVLQSILLIRQSYIDGFLPKTGLALNGSLLQMGTAKDIFYDDAQNEIIKIGLTWDDLVNTNFVVQYQERANVLKIKPKVFNHQIFKRTPFTNDFHYLCAERLGPRAINAVSDYQVSEHHQIGKSGEYAEHFLYIYGDQKIKNDNIYHKNSLARELKSQVQAWLQDISPGTEIKLDMHQEMDIVSLRYSFITGKQRSATYRSTSVGFGITYVLPIILSLLASNPGGLVLLENPEAHLHPKGQFVIGELMARAAAGGIQVIVETHSDHVLNGIRVAIHDKIIAPEDVAIHFFTRIEEEGRVKSKVDSPTIDIDGRLDLWPEGFFDEWDKSLERLIEPAGK